MSSVGNIGIIGHGFVGKAVEHGFKEENVLWYDKFQESTPLKEVVDQSNIIFLCLPTPFKGEHIDLQIIDEVLEEIVPWCAHTDKVLVIKSTVVPGTTKKYQQQYPDCKFCFNPEFLTEKNYLYDFDHPDRTVLGVEREDALPTVKALYEKRFPGVPLYITDTTSAEVVKYMANTFLSTKVIFANEINALCERLGVNYENIAEMVIADKRIGPSHFGISEERGFGGKCFPKDIIAFMGLYKDLNIDHKLLDTVWKKNLEIRRVKDWEDIPFVTSSEQ